MFKQQQEIDLEDIRVNLGQSQVHQIGLEMDSLLFFSLDLKRKFGIKIPAQAVGHYNDLGPVFGYGHCFDISSGCLNNSSSYHSTSQSYEGTNEMILTKERNFTVADYEIFQIKFQ